MKIENKVFISNSKKGSVDIMKKGLYGGHDPSTLVEAVVARVYETYMVTYPRQAVGDLTPEDSITVSLSGWKGTDEPQSPQVVMLVNPMLYDRGWRAVEAYPITPFQGGKS